MINSSFLRWLLSVDFAFFSLGAALMTLAFLIFVLIFLIVGTSFGWLEPVYLFCR